MSPAPALSRTLARLWRFGPAAVLTALIPALSLLPARFFKTLAKPLPPIPGWDKLVHAAMYAALAAALFHALAPDSRRSYRHTLLLALAASLYGGALELGQKYLTRSRSLDPLDAAANAAGAFLCMLLACAWARRRGG